MLWLVRHHLANDAVVIFMLPSSPTVMEWMAAVSVTRSLSL